MTWPVASLMALCLWQPQPPWDVVERALREALRDGGTAPAMTHSERAPRQMREVISRHIAPALVTGALSVSGRDYRFWSSATAGVILLRYPSAATAKRMAALASRRDYFRNSVALVRYSASALDCTLVIAYTQQSGDEHIVRALKSLPAAFRGAGAGTHKTGRPRASRARPAIRQAKGSD